MIIWAVVFLWLLNIFFSFIVIVVWGIWYSSTVTANQDPNSETSMRIFISPVTWIINFLTLIGLLYLFYYSGIKTLKRDRTESTDLNHIVVADRKKQDAESLLCIQNNPTTVSVPY